MSIRFHCPHCHKKLGIGSHRAGAHIHCPVCSGALTVPRELGLDQRRRLTLRPVAEIQALLVENPAQAFQVRKRLLSPPGRA